MQGLKKGTLLRHGTYRIERTLGQGGFGIAYLAYDLNLERHVAIKEFFPKDFCDRDGSTSHVTLGSKNTTELVTRLKEKFVKEARNIAKLNHPGIIRIYGAFEENNTAYYVMEYIEGRSLSEIVKRCGPIPEKQALDYVEEVGDALEYVHRRNMNHLDVKPSNILVRESDGKPILIDFGLAKRYDSEGYQTSTSPTGISHGFAPMEQYKAEGVTEFSPQTDLYSLAATLYYILSGVTPPQATDLAENELTFPSTIPVDLIGPIGKAMSTSRKRRHESIGLFINEISEKKVHGMQDHKEKAISIKTDNIDSPNQHKSELTIQSDNKKATSSNANKTYRTDSQKQHKSEWEGQTYNKKDSKILGRKVAISIIIIIGIFCGVITIYNYLKKNQTSNFESLQSQEEIIENLINNMVNVEGGTHKNSHDFKDIKIKTFSIGKYEVTQKEWNALMESNPSRFKGDALPVENVTLNECKEFIEKLNALTNKKFRLPTEAEWEYAAQGGRRNNNDRYSGSDDINKVAWYNKNSEGKTHKVGSKSKNKLGLYDMSGNVWEWTSSKYLFDDGLDYNLPVFRGGGWNNDANDCRVTSRFTINSEHQSSNLGFRLAL